MPFPPPNVRKSSVVYSFLRPRPFPDSSLFFFFFFFFFFSPPPLASRPPASPPAGGLDFSALLGGGVGASNPWAVPPASSSSSTSNAPAPAPATAGSAAAPVANPEETYAAQLSQMNDMGFTDTAACVRALVSSQGNVNMAVERMLGGGV